MKKFLTDVFVRSVEAPVDGRVEITDLRCSGLTLRVTQAGVKSWSFRFRDPRSRKLTRATIGSYPTVSLQMARERAAELGREVAGGVNPVERKRQDREEASARTFQALATRYMAEHARRHKRTADADERVLRLHVLPHWADRPYDSLGRRDVIELCEGVVAKGWPIQANRVQALVSKVFSFAVDADLVALNPCARLKKRSKENRDTRVLSDDEIRLFWRDIGKSPNSERMGQALRLVLLTGVRVTELAGAEVKEFDRLDEADNAIWTIPAARAKNGHAHVVPLSPLALAIVDHLLQRARDAKVRPAAAESGRSAGPRFLLSSPGNLQDPIDGHALSVAMARFGNAVRARRDQSAEPGEDRAASETWSADRPSAHDLRRTLATRLAASGTPAEDVSACLNHVRRTVTAMHYDQYDRAREKRVALASWSAQIERLTGGICGRARLGRAGKERDVLRERAASREAATSDS